MIIHFKLVMAVCCVGVSCIQMSDNDQHFHSQYWHICVHCLLFLITIIIDDSAVEELPFILLSSSVYLFCFNVSNVFQSYLAI